MFRLTAGQSSSDFSIILPRYLKSATNLIVSSPSYPVKLNSISKHRLVTCTYPRLFRISVFLEKHAILRCLISRPSGMCITYMSNQGSTPLPSCRTKTSNRKCLYMKCSRIRPALWSVCRNPSTGHSMDFRILGKETTYVVVPTLPTLTPRVCGGINPYDRSMWCLSDEAATNAPHSK